MAAKKRADTSNLEEDGLTFDSLRQKLRSEKILQHFCLLMQATVAWVEQDISHLVDLCDDQAKATELLWKCISDARRRKLDRDDFSAVATDFVTFHRFPKILYDEFVGLVLGLIQTSSPQRSESLTRMSTEQGIFVCTFKDRQLFYFFSLKHRE